MAIKTICENCSATFLVVHDLDEDDYIEQYCPFCGEEHEQFEAIRDYCDVSFEELSIDY